MRLNIYSSLKPAWHVEKIKDLREGKQIVPSQVQLIISDLCNQDCTFCSYRSESGFSSEDFAEGINHNPNRKIPTEKVLEILDDCAAMGVKAIQFTGGGEPTVHPDHIRIFEHAQNIGLQTALVTNGIKIKPHKVFERMEWVRVSLDAGTLETYNRIRKSNLFQKALDSIKYLSSLNPTVGVGFVVTTENYNEIYQAALIAKNLGADYIRLSAVFSTAGIVPYEPIYGIIREHINKAHTLENDTFSIVDLFGDRIEDLRQGRPDYSFCGYQQFNVYIGGNLKVYRCCTTSYTHHGEVGDLSHQRFSEWFKDREPLYKSFDARSCHHCQFRDKNKIINFMLQKQPAHVDFV